MNLLQTIRIIEKVAMEQPAVNMICENDIYKLNADGNTWRYGAFAFVQGQHSSSVDDDFFNFDFSFFYVDRLTDGKKNQLDIQSTGIEVLDNIIQKLEKFRIYAESSYTFQPFNQRFADDCAGVFVNVTLLVAKDAVCPEGFADFNDDFNEDFLII